ncbi:hypothetical protein QQS21_000659 [Conoideocrella luteorostrata]|uniref:HET-domain-containing protein n=1 Tax=Conoideocrella luteorostrata TaxID=1105319 RepID=A0AAJ0G2E7_9HYPO|nr:hypothetical protein QQS21_000659 [Conoideocrella luteorostrata]
MWLINTTTISLELFYGDETPAYAILSHTWGDDELSFQEFRGLARLGTCDEIRNKAGYRKIVATCEQARSDGYRYAWVDTCCIDKSSSAELTEAINSMFAWYRSSQICYAMLGDLSIHDDAIISQHRLLQERLEKCRWFTRGWCLQELLAPRHIRFFSHDWREIGTKDCLGDILSRITGIPKTVLIAPQGKDLHDLPVARRISWMARRRTTRIEDLSYSLLGILGIHMPMLYGEGSMAFQRLQEEIIRKYNDMSIFAWRGAPRASEYMPVLASSPSDFLRDAVHDGEEEHSSSSLLGDKLRTQFSLTNQGIYFPTARIYCQNGTEEYRYQYLLALNYRDAAFRGIRDQDWYIALQKVGPGLFVRIYESPERQKAFRNNHILDPLNESVCIINNISESLSRQLSLWERYAVRLRWKPWKKSGRKYWNIRTTEPRANWDLIGGQFLLEMASEQYMHIAFVPGNYETNPQFKYFVLVIQLGGGAVRDPSRISVKIVNSDIWPGVNETPFQFTSKESLALRAIAPRPTTTGDGLESISLAGYYMWVSVTLETQKNGLPYHLVYIDWKESAFLRSRR